MEPRIQYAKTADGVNIAWATAGKGPPLVVILPPGMAHVQRDWVTYAGLFQRLAGSFCLTWYDPRGSGLSDRDAVDFSIDALVRDVDAVVRCAGVASFSLFATANAVPVAVVYAASSPDRVSRLILHDGYASFSDFAGSPGFLAADALIDRDWMLYRETIARVVMTSDDVHLVEAFSGHMCASVEQATYSAYLQALRNHDSAIVLPEVKAPTLVLHTSDNRVYPARGGQRLAAEIPGASFVTLDNVNLDRIAALVEEFLGVAEGSESAISSAFRTVLFTDLVGHTQMMSRLGDERGRAVLREHERITREMLKAHGGTEVKTMGDGFMASFGSVTKAVECAIALQKAFDDRNTSPGVRFQPDTGGAGVDRGVGASHASPEGAASGAPTASEPDPTSPPAHPEPVEGRAEHEPPAHASRASARAGGDGSSAPEPLYVRVGLNAGEPIEEDGDLFGATVILAARIAAKAEGGEILVANAVRELCSGKGFLFSDRGEFVAKGFEEPVRVYEVRWRDE